jgi:hypothetical protein
MSTTRAGPRDPGPPPAIDRLTRFTAPGDVLPGLGCESGTWERRTRTRESHGVEIRSERCHPSFVDGAQRLEVSHRCFCAYDRVCTTCDSRCGRCRRSCRLTNWRRMRVVDASAASRRRVYRRSCVQPAAALEIGSLTLVLRRRWLVGMMNPARSVVGCPETCRLGGSALLDTVSGMRYELREG